MYKPFSNLFIFVVLLIVSINCKRKKNKYGENDVLEKSEVTLRFPVYALKMPPIITSRKKTNAKVDPIPVSCNSYNITKSLNDLRKKIRCVPRETVVEISAPDGSKVIPNTVVVKRCGGMCSGGKKCLPKKSTNVEFYVKTTNQKSLLVFCNKISVSEDTECHCDCPVKKSCSQIDQKFDPNLCKCICTNKEDENECMEKTSMNFKWSTKTCSCGCKREKPCTTGTVFMRDKCRCVKA